MTGDVESSTMCWCGGDHWQTCVNGNAFFKAEKFGGNLTLIMIHSYDAIEITATGCYEQCVSREGSCYIQAFSTELFDGWSDDLDFFGAHEAAFSGVGVEACDGEAGGTAQVRTHEGGEEAGGGAHAGVGDEVRDGAQGDMGGNAGGPEFVGSVDLRAEAFESEQAGEVVHFVFLSEARYFHGLLVEGGEDEGVDLTGPKGFDCGAEGGQGESSGYGGNLGYGRGFGKGDGEEFAGGDQLRGDACGVSSLVKDACIADEDGFGKVHGCGIGEEAGGYFGADPGRVSGEEADTWLWV